MDFFEHQRQARRSTRWLILLFALAVVLIVVAMNGAAYSIDQMVAGYRGLRGAVPPVGWWQRSVWLWTTLGTCGVIGLGSLFRLQQLAGGGKAVAEMVGATPVDPSTQDPDLRRLANVVAEMTIASGVRLPALYVMEQESAINAFVAGLTPRETVLVVTRGALDALNRDQLQGVIGHEFSHIFFGDMQLNTRLIGILAGLNLMGQSGLFLLRSLRYSGRRSSRGGGQLIAAVLAVGAALTVIGYIGLFCGRLIKAAVSRQREFLADAAAVQYTRNPLGIAGALSEIERRTFGSVLGSRYAEDMSHICFAETRWLLFADLLATHPPLKERIRRISPGYRHQPHKPLPQAAPPPSRTHLSGAEVVGMIGQLQPQQLLYATAVLAAIPRPVETALRNPRSAKAVLYALLYAHDDHDGDGMAALLQQREGLALANQVTLMAGSLAEAGVAVRLPVIDLALPHLRRLPPGEVERFLGVIDALIGLDKHLTLFEYLLRTLLFVHLSEKFKKRKQRTKTPLAAVLAPAAELLAALCCAGHPDPAQAEAAYRAAAVHLGEGVPPWPGEAACHPRRLHEGLQRLMALGLDGKRQLVTALADGVLYDRAVQPEEAELLRLACDVLEVPVPPLVLDAVPTEEVTGDAMENSGSC